RETLSFRTSFVARDGLCQAPVYQIQVPSRITAQQGLCVLLPCHFTANFESSGVPYKYWFLRNDDRDTSLAVATTDPGRALREPGGRIRLVGDAPDDCSLHISDVRAGDRDHYYFRFVKGDFKYSEAWESWRLNFNGVSCLDLTEQPVLRVPEVLLSGQLVIVTCQAPGSCSGTPPQITWTGGFDYTARNVSLALMNGSISYSSELSFTPAPGDDGKELVCMVTYPAVVGWGLLVRGARAGRLDSSVLSLALGGAAHHPSFPWAWQPLFPANPVSPRTGCHQGREGP
uniref:Ig-like domain-containing protein n=1 Tax=Gopherus agassizii TaxID=38772 RepID=A0A452HWN7_9SAUR